MLMSTDLTDDQWEYIEPFIPPLPVRADDSDPQDFTLAEQGIKLIAPHHKTRVKPQAQDGRPLRRYKRRWRVERLFA